MNAAEKRLLTLAVVLLGIGWGVGFLPAWAHPDSMAWGESFESQIAPLSVPSQPPTSSPQADVPGSLPSKAQTPLIVHVNQASVAQLQSLPGVGPALAQRIVDLRQKKGKYGKPQDLLAVKGIGKKKLKKVIPHLKFD